MGWKDIDVWWMKFKGKIIILGYNIYNSVKE